MKATIKRNLAQQGIEIKFDGRPDDSVLSTLRGKGFRWARAGHWYIKFNESIWKWVNDTYGEGGDTPVESSTPQYKSTRNRAIINEVLTSNGRVPVTILKDEIRSGKLQMAAYKSFDGMQDMEVYINKEDLRWIDADFNDKSYDMQRIRENRVNDHWSNAIRLNDDGTIDVGDTRFRYKQDVEGWDYDPRAEREKVQKAANEKESKRFPYIESDFFVPVNRKPKRYEYPYKTEKASESTQVNERVIINQNGYPYHGKILKVPVTEWTSTSYSFLEPKNAVKTTSKSYSTVIQLDNGQLMRETYYTPEGDNEKPIWNELKIINDTHPHDFFTLIVSSVSYYYSAKKDEGNAKKLQNIRSHAEKAQRILDKLENDKTTWLTWEAQSELHLAFARIITGETELEQTIRQRLWKTKAENVDKALLDSLKNAWLNFTPIDYKSNGSGIFSDENTKPVVVVEEKTPNALAYFEGIKDNEAKLAEYNTTKQGNIDSITLVAADLIPRESWGKEFKNASELDAFFYGFTNPLLKIPKEPVKWYFDVYAKKENFFGVSVEVSKDGLNPYEGNLFDYFNLKLDKNKLVSIDTKEYEDKIYDLLKNTKYEFHVKRPIVHFKDAQLTLQFLKLVNENLDETLPSYIKKPEFKAICNNVGMNVKRRLLIEGNNLGNYSGDFWDALEASTSKKNKIESLPDRETFKHLHEHFQHVSNEGLKKGMIDSDVYQRDASSDSDKKRVKNSRKELIEEMLFRGDFYKYKKGDKVVKNINKDDKIYTVVGHDFVTRFNNEKEQWKYVMTIDVEDKEGEGDNFSQDVFDMYDSSKVTPSVSVDDLVNRIAKGMLVDFPFLVNYSSSDKQNRLISFNSYFKAKWDEWANINVLNGKKDEVEAYRSMSNDSAFYDQVKEGVLAVLTSNKVKSDNKKYKFLSNEALKKYIYKNTQDTQESQSNEDYQRLTNERSEIVKEMIERKMSKYDEGNIVSYKGENFKVSGVLGYLKGEFYYSLHEVKTGKAAIGIDESDLGDAINDTPSVSNAKAETEELISVLELSIGYLEGAEKAETEELISVLNLSLTYL